MNLRSIDLNLLVIFEALIAELSVTRAAHKIGVSPSAMSHGLRRLRATFNDELVTRTAQGLVPTRRALQLVEPIRGALKEIQGALGEELDFDPKTSSRAFRIQLSNYFSGCVLPSLCARVRGEAPRVQLIFDYPPRYDSLDLEDPGSVQILVAGRSPASAEHRRETVFEDRLVVLMRRDHPAARQRMTADLFGRLTHLKLVSPGGFNFADQLLGKHGWTRRATVQLPNSFPALSIVRETDLCATVSETWTAFDREASGLVAVPLPLPENRFTIEQVWHVRKERDPGHRWLRGVIARTFADVRAGIDGTHADGRQRRRGKAGAHVTPPSARK